MPYNPGGLFSLVASYFATPGTTIRTEQHNPPLEDIASALSSVYIRDGRAPMTGAVNMNGFAINNVATGNSPTSVATLAQAMPIGAVIGYALKTPPPGWAMCFGQTLTSGTTYQTLRTLLINDGYPYGQDGMGNPYLPDARGCVDAGYDAMGGAPAGRLGGAFGARTGLETSPIAVSQLPNYTPPAVFGGTPMGTRFLSGPSIVGLNGSNVIGQGGTFVSFYGASNWSIDVGTPSGTVSVGSINGNQTQVPYARVQPTLIMNKIIRVSYDG